MSPAERAALRRAASVAKMRATRLRTLGDRADQWEAVLLFHRAAKLSLEALAETAPEAEKLGTWIEACGLFLEARDPVRAAEVWSRLPRTVFSTAAGAVMIDRLREPYQEAVTAFSVALRQLGAGRPAAPEPSTLDPGALRALLEAYPGVAEGWWALSKATQDDAEARDAQARMVQLDPACEGEGVGAAAWTRMTPALMSTLRIKMASERAGDALELDAVGQIAASFGRLFRDFVTQCLGLDVTLLPCRALTGSFLLEVAAPGLPPHAIETLNVLLKDTPERIGARELLELLARLQRSGIRLSVSQGELEEELSSPQLVIDAGWRKRLLQVTEAEALRHLDTRDIPQADDLERIFGLVQMVAGQHEVNAVSLGVTRRQVAYYRRAAEILGLLGDSGELTAAGRLIARLGDEDRLRATVVHFESSICGDAWIQWSRGRTLREVDPNSAPAFLEASVPGLSESTAGRRAQTLMAWHRALSAYHYAAEAADETTSRAP
ncbi:hypothetical protein [Chondromyces crocatus]|uniref:Uncharacterized protein n=1 Tax=Chondromyces crocatus TaxID=52 RepID=A0A0K1ETQ2_CHOCO|nr:hypothetical protein [Chondromyces crocatus]AKT44169.1 uncharacterized protein CMC5_084090 [Chondromyces crocatus]